MQVVFTDRAYAAVIAETAEKIKTETGGIFLGCYENGVWYVIETIDPGPKSVFQAAYFEYDRKYTEHLINKISRLYQAKLTLVGLWHRHPGSFDGFSSTDDGTNSNYAKLSPNGAVSVLVNIDPVFRITPYHVGRPLRYTKIPWKVGDSLVPEHLMRLKNAEQLLEYINGYAGKTHGKASNDKPKADFVRLLEAVKPKFQRISVTREDCEPPDENEADTHRNLLIDSLLDDITYFSEMRGLALNIEQSRGTLNLSYRGHDDTVTKVHFIYSARNNRIIFSYNDVGYLYTPGMFAALLADYKETDGPADASFKSGLLRALGLGSQGN